MTRREDYATLAGHYTRLVVRLDATVVGNYDSETRARALAYAIAARNVAATLLDRHAPDKPGRLLGMWHAAIADAQAPNHEFRLLYAVMYWRAYRRVLCIDVGQPHTR